MLPFLKNILTKEFYKKIIFEILDTKIYRNLKVYYKRVIGIAAICFLVLILAICIFFITAQKILFIYDSYTMDISGLNAEILQKTARNHHIVLKIFNTSAQDFYDFYKNISETDKKKPVIVTSYLYASVLAFPEDPEIEELFKNKKIALFGPLLDYETQKQQDKIDTEIVIEWKNNLFKNYLERINKVIFLKNSNTAQTAEPETEIISHFSEKFLSLNSSGVIVMGIFDENMTSNRLSADESENSVAVLCTRTILPNIWKRIKDHEGKIVVLDYTNSIEEMRYNLGLNNSNKKLLSYNYRLSFLSTIKKYGEITEKKVDYTAVFSFFPN